MKNKILVLVLLATITIPQVVSAAWWNPFSWNIFTRFFGPKVEEIQKVNSVEDTASTTNEVSEIEKLRAELEELKNQKNTDSSPKTTPKSNNTNSSSVKTQTNLTSDNQTEQYKKTLMNKVAEAVAILNTSSKYTDETVIYIEKRINNLNSLIGKNESLANEAPDAYSKELLNKFNDMYISDNNMSRVSKNGIIRYKQLADDIINELNIYAVSLSQKPTISSEEFNKENNELNNTINTSNSLFSSIKNTVSNWLTFAKEQDSDYDYALELLRARMNSLSNSSNYVSGSYSSYLNTPTIAPPRIPTCFFSTYNSINGITGNMSCF